MKNTPNNPEQPADMPEMDEETRLVCLLAEIDMRFPTDDDAVEEIYRMASEEGIVKCRYCGSLDLERDYGARASKCKSCNKESWFTSGTVFERMRTAKAWLTAIFLREHKVAISTSRFHRAVGVAQSTASNILTKISMVLQNHMGEDAQMAPSALFIDVVCKRSRETPARAHPIAEQEEIERDNRTKRETSMSSADLSFPKEHCTALAASHDADAQSIRWSEYQPEAREIMKTEVELDEAALIAEFSERDKRIYGFISTTPVHADVIVQELGIPVHQVSISLIMLELAGVVKRLAGDRYERSSLEKSQERISRFDNGGVFTTGLKETVLDFRNFVKIHFHGISRKYLQQYIAAYWCYVDRIRWHSGALLKACLRFRSISYEEILNYVSPILVKIMPCQ